MFDEPFGSRIVLRDPGQRHVPKPTPIARPAASPASLRAHGLIKVDSPEAGLSPITTPEAFEAMFVGSPDLLCVRDLRGKLIRLNPAWSTLLGFSLDALHGAPLLDLVHPEDVWATHDVMHGVSDERMVLGFSNRYRRLDGGYRRFEWTARQFGDYVFGLGRDVTER
jgi:PAS domain S-box-containing protein